MIRIFVILVCVYVLLCGFVYLKQRSLIYYPVDSKAVKSDASFLVTNDGLQIRVDATVRESDDVVLYFGGNAEDVSYTLGDIAETFPDHSVYLMRYRGYGGSEGSPTEAGLVSDALALFDQVATSDSSITVIGRSLGSGVATQVVAARPNVHRMVLVTPFDSIVNVSKRHFWYFPVGLLLKDRYDSSQLAVGINVPTTVIAAARDTIIPMEHSEALFESFPGGVAKLIVIDGAGHNTIGMSAHYAQALRGIEL